MAYFPPMLSVVNTVPSSSFTFWDWVVIALFFAFTTMLGGLFAGKQATIRDFFLAGRKLPWWAISGSIIATEISAVTFIGVPTFTFFEGGNVTYLQLAIGAILARVIIGLYFVPRYYQREIYSPYDYMGQELGVQVKRSTTALFFVGAILGQGARLYVTALILQTVTGWGLIPSIWIIGAFSILWTLFGGMTTVIWTDVIQFVIMVSGAVLTLWFALHVVPGGFSEMLQSGWETGRFQLLDTRTDPTLPYTLWCGLLATPFLNLAALGTDQVMAQRMFCCRNQKDAQKAIIASSVGIGVAVLMLLVGVALYCYFRHQPFTNREAELVAGDRNSLLPIFIVRAMPEGLRGVVVAAVFASAISTLESALAALAQGSISLLGKRSRTSPAQGWLARTIASDIGLSRLLVVAWGVILCLMATACINIARQYTNVVELALALVGYTYGPLLGIFLLAFFRTKRDASGLPWGVALSMLAVFAMSQQGWMTMLPVWNVAFDASAWIVWVSAATALLIALIRFPTRPLRVGCVTTVVILIALLHRYGIGLDALGHPKYPGFTWSYPLGTIITLVLGYVLGERRNSKAGCSPRDTAPG